MSKQHTRAEMVAEIKIELTMRKKVWGNTIDRKTGTPFFSSQAHQARYNTMAAALELLEGITDTELQKLRANIERRKEEGQAQTTLFL